MVLGALVGVSTAVTGVGLSSGIGVGEGRNVAVGDGKGV
jgi:hypothetical protein